MPPYSQIPGWVDRNEYPFESRFFPAEGGKLHYVDEGQGEPIVMVHGNPTWSFLYRHLIKGLSKKYRCVAVDHLGFGLSDKPLDWSYLPEDHARNLEKLIDTLGLKDITLVIQDWGGPIGMSYAVSHPENVKRLVIMNTWAWSVKGIFHYESFSWFMSSFIGRFLIERFNFFAGPFMKVVFGDKSKLPKPIHDQYKNAFPTPEERRPCWKFPQAIIGSSQWLGHTSDRLEKVRSKPALLLWGMKDIAFRQQELKRWEGILDNKKVIRLENTGHFVQEELKSDLVPMVEEFMTKSP